MKESRAAVNAALKDVARGMSLRHAEREHHAKYTSLHRAWVALGGPEESELWLAFKESVMLDTVDETPDVEARAEKESPLGPRLRRRANRYGDGVPYGTHGEWGLYREGVKEMSAKVAAGTCSAAEASSLLAAEGVHVSEGRLAKKAKLAPGKSPEKAGVKQLLKKETEDEIAKEIRFYRAHSIVCTKPTIKCIANAIIQKTGEQDKFKDGETTDHWYYGFLDRSDMSTGDSKPLESDRDLWLTSAVSRHPLPCPVPSRG